jgi:uncharacterized protein YkwD
LIVAFIAFPSVFVEAYNKTVGSISMPAVTTGTEEGSTEATSEDKTAEKANNKTVIPTDRITNPNNLDSSSIARKVHSLVNEHREDHGIRTMKYDEKLQSIAYAHSVDMAQNNFFDHVNEKGYDPSDRAERAGYTCHKELEGGYYTEGIAENIAQNYVHDTTIRYVNGFPIYDWLTEDELAYSIFDQWRTSPGHNENMLEPEYDREGLGIFIEDDGKVYATENFC